MTKVALITGASRGIGRSVAIGLAKKGYNIVIASKSIIENPKLPGTIHTVSDEMKKLDLGVEVLPIKTDLRKYDDIINLSSKIKEKFNRLDVLFNNAGALWWKNMNETPIDKYDLVNSINSRASYALSRECIPLMEKNGGHIIMHSPPLPTNIDDTKNILSGKIGYMISKWGMTLTALGISQEFDGKKISANTIWPATAIESYATKNLQLGDEKSWRKDQIIVDCIGHILKTDPNLFTGNQLIDETYLRSLGYTDLRKYQCIPGYEPIKLDDLFKSNEYT